AAAIRERGATPMAALAWRPELGTTLLVVRRDTGEEVVRIAAGDRYSLHTIGAHDAAGGDRLIVDLVELDRPVYDQYEVIPDLFTSVGEGRPVRLTLDLAAGAVVDRREIAYAAAPDFPAIDPRGAQRPGDDLWLLGIAQTGRPGRKFFDQLVHARWSRPDEVELWQAPRGQYLASEPLFVPDPAGDAGEGAIVCLLLDVDEAASRCLVFDAQAIARGPRAVLDLETLVPPMFHAAFAPS
ncbi:MAG TPA: carotenoid oxygenase family protein, partial [Thermoanaerobaculia bacterium]